MLLPAAHRQSCERQYAKAQEIRRLLAAGARPKVITFAETRSPSLFRAFFQSFGTIFPDVERRRAGTSDDVSRITEVIVTAAQNRVPNLDNPAAQEFVASMRERAVSWFDEEFKAALDVDVFARDFPKDRGYAISHFDRMDLLILRCEDLPRVLRGALSAFVDVRSLTVQNWNRTKDKWNAELYQAILKTIIMPEEFVESQYGSKYTKHFYTVSEVERFKTYWLKRGRA